MPRMPDEDLRKGSVLARAGNFAEAIPHLLAARARNKDDYATAFNLALCYVGTGQFPEAIELLSSLRDRGHRNENVFNLLAQAQIGNAQPNDAWESFQQAAHLTPQNEKLYLFVADACMDRKEYALGLKVVALGVEKLPDSVRLHYERAVFRSELDQSDLAREDFEFVRKRATDSDIGYLAAVHEAFLRGDMSETIQLARTAIKKSYEDPAVLIILAEALVRAGAVPGQPEFGEAEAALQKAVEVRPSDWSARVALGKLCLMAGKLDDAIANLERARQLDPGNGSVYSNLAKAYQRKGDSHHAEEALAMLASLNQAKADRIRNAPGDRKAAYTSLGSQQALEEEKKPPQ